MGVGRGREREREAMIWNRRKKDKYLGQIPNLKFRMSLVANSRKTIISILASSLHGFSRLHLLQASYSHTSVALKALRDSPSRAQKTPLHFPVTRIEPSATSSANGGQRERYHYNQETIQANRHFSNACWGRGESHLPRARGWREEGEGTKSERYQQGRRDMTHLITLPHNQKRVRNLGEGLNSFSFPVNSSQFWSHWLLHFHCHTLLTHLSVTSLAFPHTA